MEVDERVEGMVSQLHVGIMVWKVKMLRNERMSEDSFFVVVVGFMDC
jgi:acetolactate synthase small subunit